MTKMYIMVRLNTHIINPLKNTCPHTPDGSLGLDNEFKAHTTTPQSLSFLCLIEYRINYTGNSPFQEYFLETKICTILLTITRIGRVVFVRILTRFIPTVDKSLSCLDTRNSVLVVCSTRGIKEIERRICVKSLVSSPSIFG